MFLNHCRKLYGVEEDCQAIEAEVKKRDEVYQLVAQELGQPHENYPGRLAQHFKEHALMMEVIEKFKKVSKLEDIKSMGELYYFLKSDR